MNLQQKLKEMKAASRGKMSPEVLAAMARALEQLEENRPLDKVLATGQQAPGFALSDAGGTTYRSSELLRRGPLVVNFYRGSW